jgi:hypothetical protein
MSALIVTVTKSEAELYVQVGDPAGVAPPEQVFGLKDHVTDVPPMLK